MEKRKLATIVVISDIRPIEGADNIEQCKIKGWNVVIKKNEFKDGDLAVYCEIDSLMPQRSEFEFLAPRKYRIKTTRLKGTLSQGIAFPLSILPMSVIWLGTPDGLAIDVGHGFFEPVGIDVTELLGIVKFDPPIPACLGGLAKGNFPSHSIKTDEERIQNLTDNFENYHDNYTWTATEKLDGCLDENTNIETENGIKSIKEICETKYTGKIKSFDLNKNKIVWKNITSHSIKENNPIVKTRLINNLRSKHWYKITLENGKEILLTENHEIWISNLLCWRRADELVGNEEFLVKN